MKVIAFCVILTLLSVISFSQNKDLKGFYSGGVVYEEISDSASNTLGSRPLGKDAYVFVDTFFKSYTLIYIDSDNTRITLKLKFVRNYIPGDKNPKATVLLMEYTGHYFMLTDLLKSPFGGEPSLVITMEEALSNGKFLTLRVRGLVKRE